MSETNAVLERVSELPIVPELSLHELAGLLDESQEGLEKRLRQREIKTRPGSRRTVPSALVREILEERGADFKFRVIAHANLRGGIGKTTSTVTTAVRCAQYGLKTCLLDLDSQGSASLAFDAVPETDDPIFLDIWQKPEEYLEGSLRELGENLYLLPSALENGLLDSSLANPAAQKSAVRGVCEELRKMDFDLVLIDCPPSLGAAVISSICAADIIVIPVASDAFSFRGLQLTLREIRSVCSTFGLDAPRCKVLFSRYDGREKASEQALARLQELYGEYFIPSVIRTSTDFSRALERRRTIFSNAAKKEVRKDYDNCIGYILDLPFVVKGKER